MPNASALMTKPVTLREPVRGFPNDYGQPATTWTNHDAVCHYRRLYTDDASGVGVIVTDTVQFWFPPGTDIEEDWEIVLDGETYVVVGDTSSYWNPRLERDEYVTANGRKRSL